MSQVMFKTEITVEDKYREFDISLLVWATIREDKCYGYPTELIINIDEVEVDDSRDVSPYKNGDSILSKLNEHQIDWLEDQAASNYNSYEDSNWEQYYETV